MTPLSGRQQAVVYVYLKTGSRFESSSENGLSHFVEHMLFRGTKGHPTSHRLATAFESLGGTLEASTAADHGTLSIAVPHENLSRVLPLVAEVFAQPLFCEVDIERSIIIEEILEDLNDEGELIDPASLSRKLAFGDHSLALPITGSVENVRGFSLDQLKSHHLRTYQACNTIVSVAGPVDPERVTREIEQHFGTVFKGNFAPSSAPVPSQGTARYLHVDHPGSSQTSVALCYRCPGRTHHRQAALEMLLRVIDDGMATRLYHEICDSRGLCYSVAGTYESYDEVGIVEFEADAAHERAPVVLEQMLHVTDQLTTELISDEEFQRIQNRTRWQYEAILDDVDSVADFFAQARTTNTARSPEERLAELLEVTREEIREAASEIFVPQGRNVVSVGTQRKSGRARMDELSRRQRIKSA